MVRMYIADKANYCNSQRQTLISLTGLLTIDSSISSVKPLNFSSSENSCMSYILLEVGNSVNIVSAEVCAAGQRTIVDYTWSLFMPRYRRSRLGSGTLMCISSFNLFSSK